jgi:hypothetical protein
MRLVLVGMRCHAGCARIVRAASPTVTIMIRFVQHGSHIHGAWDFRSSRKHLVPCTSKKRTWSGPEHVAGPRTIVVDSLGTDFRSKFTGLLPLRWHIWGKKDSTKCIWTNWFFLGGRPESLYFGFGSVLVLYCWIENFDKQRCHRTLDDTLHCIGCCDNFCDRLSIPST